MSQEKILKKQSSDDSSATPLPLAEAVIGAVVSHLPSEIAATVVSYAYAPDDESYRSLLRGGLGLFPKQTRVLDFLSSVVHGEPRQVIEWMKKAPELLLQKVPEYTVPCGDVLYDVSPLQAILFYIDWDMLNNFVKPIIMARNDEKYRKQVYEQSLQMKGGGADLVKMTQDPTKVDVTQFREGDNVYPLLENNEGFIFCEGNFFYANQRKKTIELIHDHDHDHDHDQDVDSLIKLKVPVDDRGAFANLTASLIAMEDNSSRRLSIDEHKLMERVMMKTMGLQLEEQPGIRYKHADILYQDTRVGDPITAYRHFIRLCDTYAPGTPWDDVDAAWLDKGKKLRDSIPLLQRICEEKSFYPLPSKASLMQDRFRRSLQFVNWLEGGRACFGLPFAAGCGLGFDFSLYKGWDVLGGGVGIWAGGGRVRAAVDLAAVCRIVEVGKASVAEFIKELAPTLSASSGRRASPGCIVS